MKQKKLAESGVAKTTLKTRKQQIKVYFEFCVKFDLVAFPCSAAQASLYVTFLADKMKPVSVRNYLSAVWFFQKLRGFPDFSSNFILKKTLDGVERSSSSKPVVTYPLSSVDMLKIYSCLNMNIFVDRLFWCSIVVAFRAILRCGHITDSVHSMKVKDVTVCNQYIRLHIVSSKTDQFGRHPYDIYLTRFDGSPLCPALLLLDLLKVRGLKMNSNLFSFNFKGRRVTQSYVYVNSRLKNLCVTCGILPKVSTHSLRHGGATLLKNLGMCTADIMKRANWRSKAVYGYLHNTRTDLLKLDKLASKYLSNLPM